MTHNAPLLTKARGGARRAYGAVAVLTATALLTATAGTPSFAHDENIIKAENRAGDYEVVTWQDTIRSSSLPDVRIETTLYSDDDVANGTCYASTLHKFSFKNDTSSAQKAKMRAAINAAFVDRSIGGTGSSTPTWTKRYYDNALYVSYRSPSSSSVKECPDYLNPNNYSRMALRKDQSAEEILKFMVSYATIGTTFAVAGFVGAVAGIAMSNTTAAGVVGVLVGCGAGAIGQMLLKAVNGLSWKDVGIRMATACFVDGSVAALNAVAGAWLKGGSRAARTLRHAIIDAVGGQYRYAALPDILEEGVQIVTDAAQDAAAAARRS